MERVHPDAAGIDIGAKKVFTSAKNEPVRSDDTFTRDFNALGDWLVEKGVKTVAMEATGCYWNILYETLESKGLDVWLVDGRKTKQVPGRKTDVKDCQWIQQLHSYGLLERCYVSSGDLKDLRSFQRLREDHIRSASMHINHMQKALTEMNIRLPEVLSQIQGSSGMRMIEAILNGERDGEKLVELCHTRLKKNKKEELLKALEGYYTEAGLFKLQQAYDAYHFYQARIGECDQRIEKVLERINEGKELQDKERSKKKRKRIRHNPPRVKELGEHMLKAFGGKDATCLPGFTDYTWMQLMSETGTDLSRWGTEKHFTSWLGLAPGQNNSGKKNKSQTRGRPYAGQIFREMAQSIMNSKKIALGAFGRRIRARKGPSIAIKAVARKLAAQYWRLMVKGTEYVEKGIEDYEKKLNESKMKTINRLCNEVGVKVVVEE